MVMMVAVNTGDVWRVTAITRFHLKNRASDAFGELSPREGMKRGGGCRARLGRQVLPAHCVHIAKASRPEKYVSQKNLARGISRACWRSPADLVSSPSSPSPMKARDISSVYHTTFHAIVWLSTFRRFFPGFDRLYGHRCSARRKRR